MATIENLTTGETATQDLTSNYALCEQDAEWIVEDFEEDGGLVPFANFGTVTFYDASASGPGGTYTPCDGNIIDIEQNGKVLTDVVIDNGCSNVTVQYV